MHSKIHYLYTTTEKTRKKKHETVRPGVCNDERLASARLEKMIRTIIRTGKTIIYSIKSSMHSVKLHRKYYLKIISNCLQLTVRLVHGKTMGAFHYDSQYGMSVL